MDKQITLQKALHFFLTKIIVGIVVIGALVTLAEWLCKLLFNKTSLTDDTKNIIVAVADSVIAVFGYIFLFKIYERRRIKELSASTFGKNTLIGCVIGFVLQSLFILVIYISGTYSVVHLNSASTLITPFAFALTAGVVAEILMIGILFRLLEEQLGTVIALTIFIILFAVLHVKMEGATFISVSATAMQAGFMLPAAYVFSRSLWLPIFLHFSWDFAEPGIFGGINSSSSINQGFFSSKIIGSPLITGGPTGPQDSIQSLILCLLTGIIFLILAKRKNNFIKPHWQTTATNKSQQSQD
ncbi:MAG: CPBP family intramembrane glutamic endopeptidase [Chitinophagaceae bacterium]